MCFKYDEDDILEILTEYLAEENGFGTFASRAKIIGESGKDLRLIAIIGENDNTEIENLNIEDIDSKMEYNGNHWFLKNNPEFQL